MPSVVVANAKRLLVWLVSLAVAALSVALAIGSVP
ncbi:hypothetical protein SAMN05216218_1148 [Halorientalis regularis]|jgi:hypothetical protein|uniref:Uncharacterized protein n=1 Tax=Halorientalis regularis TaxID=660518 RepID=A0A1G7R3Y6_9EURY|nr:hypothetical protein SAMN05216218_1148 [Halorientalis regularis]